MLMGCFLVLVLLAGRHDWTEYGTVVGGPHHVPLERHNCACAGRTGGCARCVCEADAAARTHVPARLQDLLQGTGPDRHTR